MMEITIRPASKPEVGEFFYKAFPSGANSPTMLHSSRVYACDEMYVAVHDGRIVAGVTLATNGLDGRNLPTLSTIFTSQECHRQGVGRQLCEFAIRRFMELGKTPVYVEVTSKGMRALVAGLSDELKQALNAPDTVDSEGDEWEPFERPQS
jgi:GNAT superfamily N-acetyltransferase